MLGLFKFIERTIKKKFNILNLPLAVFVPHSCADDMQRALEQQLKKWLNDLNDGLKGGSKSFAPMVWRNHKTM